MGAGGSNQRQAAVLQAGDLHFPLREALHQRLQAQEAPGLGHEGPQFLARLVQEGAG